MIIYLCVRTNVSGFISRFFRGNNLVWLALPTYSILLSNSSWDLLIAQTGRFISSFSSLHALSVYSWPNQLQTQAILLEDLQWLNKPSNKRTIDNGRRCANFADPYYFSWLRCRCDIGYGFIWPCQIFYAQGKLLFSSFHPADVPLHVSTMFHRQRNRFGLLKC